MRDWSDYFKKTKNGVPRDLLVRSLKHVEGKWALDLGAGALNDTRFLLKQGFDVFAVDSAKEMMKIKVPEREMKGNLARCDMAFDLFFKEFSKPKYDLITSQFALSFEKPEQFDALIDNIKQHLNPRGIFCGNIFGVDDEWVGKTNEMTFVNHDRAWMLFSEHFNPDFELIYFAEVREKAMPTIGDLKEWHYFDIIARKL